MGASATVRIAATGAGIDLLAPRRGPARCATRCWRRAPSRVGDDAAEVAAGRARAARATASTWATDNLPGEAGIVERAVSFTKGCYVGQEPVARMYHRGPPNRRLRGLRLSAPGGAGEPVMPDEREVGRRHTGVASPRLGPIGLAILRREVEAGDEVAVGARPSAPRSSSCPSTVGERAWRPIRQAAAL